MLMLVLEIDIPHASGGVALTLEKDGGVTINGEVCGSESGGEAAVAKLPDGE